MNPLNNYRKWRWTAATLLVILVVLLIPEVLLACPNCKDTLAQNDPARSGMARGYFWSILLMLSTPFVVTAGLGSYFYWLVRKARINPLLAFQASAPIKA